MNNKFRLLSKYNEIKNKTVKQISKPKTNTLIYNKLPYHVYLIFGLIIDCPPESSTCGLKVVTLPT